ncbi:MAG: PPC domain-containing DNA-binding protein, partial [Gemmatimonadota bacterium]
MRTKEMRTGETRLFVLVFDIGDEVVEGVSDFARGQGVRGAHVHGIGAFERATLAFWSWELKKYVPIEVSEQVEAVSVTGNIAITETGEVKFHAHAVVAGPDGSTRGGHLLNAYARPTFEVILR